MLRKIKWSIRALREWVEILEYWNIRNKSNTYSRKLDKLFKDSFAIIAVSPETGQPTDFPLVRIKIIRNYLIYYRIQDDAIEILAVLDGRRESKVLDL